MRLFARHTFGWTVTRLFADYSSGMLPPVLRDNMISPCSVGNILVVEHYIVVAIVAGGRAQRVAAASLPARARHAPPPPSTFYFHALRYVAFKRR